MEITSTQRYQATPDQVYAMLTDPEYLESCTAAFGARNPQVSVNGTTVEVSAEAPAPSQARTFVGDTLNVRQVFTWGTTGSDGVRRGDLTMAIQKAPAKIGGKASIVPDGTTTSVNYTIDLKVTVPLLGKKLEQQAAPVVQRLLDAQQQVGEGYLAKH